MKLQSYYYNFIYAMHLRKPRLIARIIKNYFTIIFRKEMLLRYIDVCVGLKCNLTCKHCFADNIKSDEKTEMSNDEWVDIFSQCHGLGNIAIGFTGGEPLLYKDLEKLISKARTKETLIIVCTNGMLLTARRAQSLYQVGVDVVQISIESFNPDEHNSFRQNERAWQESMQGIENALAAGIRDSIVPTVSHLNINSKGLLDLIDWAYKRKLIVNLALAAPMGVWNGRMDILLTEEDFRTIDEMVTKYPNVRRDFETNYFIRGCGAAKEKLYFTPFGDVLACPYMHISFGNVRTNKVVDIRHNMLSIKKLDGYYPKCLVAEDRDFIQGPLSHVLDKEDKVVDWEEVFDEANNIL